MTITSVNASQHTSIATETSKISSTDNNKLNNLKGLEIAGIVLIVVGAVIAIASGALIPLALTGVLSLTAALVVPVVQVLVGAALVGLTLFIGGMVMKKIGANQESEEKEGSQPNFVIYKQTINNDSNSSYSKSENNTTNEFVEVNAESSTSDENNQE